MATAGIQIKIEDKTHALEHLSEQLSSHNLDVAKVRGINVAIRKSNTQYRREIVKNYNLKYADTKSIVIAKRATYTEPEGSIAGNTKPVSLSRFNPTFTQSSGIISIKSVKNKQTGKRGLAQIHKKASKNSQQIAGVSFEIKKGQQKNLPFAFLLNSAKPGLSMQIWARGKYAGNKFNIGKTRMPIAALKTVGPFGMMTDADTQKNIEKGASDAMQQEFERQVKMLLEKAGAK